MNLVKNIKGYKILDGIGKKFKELHPRGQTQCRRMPFLGFKPQNEGLLSVVH